MTNRELVEQLFAAFQRGDLEAGFSEAVAVPDLEFDNQSGAGDALGVWRGLDGFVDMMGKVTEAFSEYSLELLETNERGDDVTLTLLEVGQGKSSGAKIERRIFVTYTFDDGKLSRLTSALEPPAG